MDDFIASESDDDTSRSKKRKRPSKPAAPRKRSNKSSPIPEPKIDIKDSILEEDELMDDVGGATASQWSYDAASTDKQPVVKPAERVAIRDPKYKEKAYTKDPDQRYPWLANIMDKDKRKPDHPEYDKRTIYIPPAAWHKFSPFETQYWKIKQNLWDTIVFFKKGKFYELYENDATVGHQEFDFKMTDRVNMRMVGVPESSLDHWVNQFIAKQYKVARVDQMETNLGKEMRERQDKSKKADKVITRELACILTAGTLVDGSMLQDDMASYCVAIKESVVDDLPAFGIAFADTATGRFYLSTFVDDVDLTKFETLIAQTGPRELLLEKSRLSTKSLRILKNNTSPTTIWTHLKPGEEFWEADKTRRELDCGGYFKSEEADEEVWPEILESLRDDDLAMSATGALISYLRFLKLERPLLSQGNFELYNPIQKNGTLILDGQTLINLEVFSNSVNGGSEGTLFSLLNKCVTPFGKRLFRSWVAHPLCNIDRINERLDAVEMLNADQTVREQFASQLVKMPDLERLISRIHAGACKPEDFVKVLEGFEQIEYTMSLLGSYKGGNGLVDRLISSMPNLDEPLSYWRSAFDRSKARDEKLLIPERGIEEDFDQSSDRIEEIKQQLEDLLAEKKKEFKCKLLKFTDVGKEIYQLEAPKSVKVPSTFRQMSATKDVKRWYFPELSQLVRELQEAEETHSQLVREVASRFFQKFDVDYETWLQAIKIISQLDCLVSLAKASASLGQPSCRPEFVDEERSTVDFQELRHPCMMNTVDDFIPNDIKLGGDQAKINLLTGANAAGKSTVLRMVSSALSLSFPNANNYSLVSLSSWPKSDATSLPHSHASLPSIASCLVSAPTTTSSLLSRPSLLSCPRPRRFSPKPHLDRWLFLMNWVVEQALTMVSLSPKLFFTTSLLTSAASATSLLTTTLSRQSLRTIPRSEHEECRSTLMTMSVALPSYTSWKTVSPRVVSVCTAPPCAASHHVSSTAQKSLPKNGNTPAVSKTVLRRQRRDVTSRWVFLATSVHCSAIKARWETQEWMFFSVLSRHCNMTRLRLGT